MKPFQREDYNAEACLIPELAVLGHCHGLRARVPGIKEHIHATDYEIFWMERGEASWWNGGERHHVAAGQVYINRPGELHGSVGPALGPCSYYFLQLRPGDGLKLPAMDCEAARRVFEVLQAPRPRCFTVTGDILSCWQSIFHEAREPGPLSGTVVRAQLHLLLTMLVREAQLQQAPLRSAAIRRALQFMAANLENDFSTVELAAAAGLSPSHFRARFRAETGYTPQSFLTRLRVESAKDMLAGGECSVGEIGRRLGFRSSQYFATVFKKLEGVSPTEFSRQENAASPELLALV